MEKSETPKPEVLREILEALKALRYGSVEITVQDGNVVQIERKEKRRIQNGQDNS
jgi:hypothetical protein